MSNQLKAPSRLRRALSLTLAMAVGASCLPVFPQSALATPTATADLSTLDLAAVDVPEEWGQVVETWRPEDRPAAGLVIHLQDLHVHPEAQANLSELIGELHSRLGIRLVGVEGATGACETDLYASLPDPPSTERIASLFLQEGLFTGAEYYAITHPDAVTLWGVEDEATYLAHLSTYQDGANSRSEAEATIGKLRDALRPLRKTLYPKPLLRLSALRDASERDEPNAFVSYLKELSRLARSLRTPNSELRTEPVAQLDLREYPHVRAALRAYELHPRLDMRQVERERGQLLNAVWPLVTPEDHQRLTTLADRASTSPTSARRYHAALLQLARAHGLLADRSGYRAFRHYLYYTRLTQQLRSPSLTDELDQLEQAVEAAHLKTDEQRALARLLRQVELLDHLVHNKLSPRDLADYRSLHAHLTPDSLRHDLRSFGHSATWPLGHSELAQLLDTLPTHERFYELAAKRDEALVEHLERAMRERKEHAAILIAGGFHTPGLTARLKARGLAYAVVTPKVDERLDEATYDRRLRNVFPSVDELIQQFDRSALVPALATGSGTTPTTEFRVGQPSGVPDQPDQTQPLSKRDATFLSFLTLKVRELAKRGREGIESMRAWINAHPAQTSLYSLAIVWESGKVILSAMGMDIPFDEAGTLLAVATMSASKPGDDEKVQPIDLNQSDLMQLQPQLRQAFPKNVLSDGAIKGILNWRQQHGLLTSLDQLTQIKGISRGTLQELRKKVKPLLPVLPDPIRLIFSSHASTEDARWVAEQMIALMAGIEKSRPIVIWLEHASPSGMPLTHLDLQRQFDRWIGQPVNWMRELVTEPMDPQLQEYLRRLFAEWRKRDSRESVRVRFLADPSPFLQGLGGALRTLETLGYAVELKAEEASFESYLAHLRGATMQYVAMRLLAQGNSGDALQALASFFRHQVTSIDGRDEALLGQIVSVTRSRPETLHLIVRGSAHQRGFLDRTAQQQVGHRHVVQGPLSQPAQHYLVTRPHAGSPEERRLLLEGLLESALVPFLRNWGIPAERFERFTSLLAAETLEAWFTEMAPTGSGTITELGARTWVWLGSHQTQMGAEALASYLSLQQALEQARVHRAAGGSAQGGGRGVSNLHDSGPGAAPMGGGLTPAELRRMAAEVNAGKPLQELVEYFVSTGLMEQWPFCWNALDPAHRLAFRDQLAHRGINVNALPTDPSQSVPESRAEVGPSPRGAVGEVPLGRGRGWQEGRREEAETLSGERGGAGGIVPTQRTPPPVRRASTPSAKATSYPSHSPSFGYITKASSAVAAATAQRPIFHWLVTWAKKLLAYAAAISTFKISKSVLDTTRRRASDQRVVALISLSIASLPRLVNATLRALGLPTFDEDGLTSGYHTLLATAVPGSEGTGSDGAGPGAAGTPDRTRGNAYGPTSGPAEPHFMLEGEPQPASASDDGPAPQLAGAPEDAEFERAFERYLQENQLAHYPALRPFFTRPIKEALLADSALRPVFLVPMAGRVGDLTVMDAPALSEIGGSILLDRYSVFSAGGAGQAQAIAQRGGEIVIGVVDRPSTETLFAVDFEVVHGRQAYFPLPDGTWLGVKGVGQFLNPDQPPFWYNAPEGERPRYEGLCLEDEADRARRSYPKLNKTDARFVRLLGYRPLNFVFDGTQYISASEAKSPDDLSAERVRPVLVFSRVLSPHRLTKLPQLFSADPGLQRLRAQLSKVLGRSNTMSLKEWFTMMVTEMGRQEGVKQRARLYKITIHEADITMAAEETDWEEAVGFDAYRTFIGGEPFNDDTDVSPFFERTQLGLQGLAQKLLILRALFDPQRLRIRDESYHRERLTPPEALQLFFESYFQNLDGESLGVWADAQIEPEPDGPVLPEVFSRLTDKVLLDVFHPAYRQGQPSPDRRQTAEVAAAIIGWARAHRERRNEGPGTNRTGSNATTPAAEEGTSEAGLISPADALIDALGLSDLERLSGATLVGASRVGPQGLIIRQIDVSARGNAADLPQGPSILLDLIGKRQTHGRFELLYDADGRLLAVFPAAPHVFPVTYVDFTPFGWDISQVREAPLHATVAAIKAANAAKRPLIEAYKTSVFGARANEVLPVQHDFGEGPYEEDPYALLELDASTGLWRASPYPVLSVGSAGEGLHSTTRHRLLIPVFPTVFSPVGKVVSDRLYYDTLWTAFDIQPEHDVLIVGPGTGADAWIASLKHPRGLCAVGINPLEVANLRTTAAIAGFSVEAATGDNIIDEDGTPRFPGRQFDRIAWNAQAYTSSTLTASDHPSIFERFHDDDVRGQSLKRFARGLLTTLKRRGVALVWNPGFRIPNLATGAEDDIIEAILRSAGAYDVYSGIPVNRFDVHVIRGRNPHEGRVYLVRWPQAVGSHVPPPLPRGTYAMLDRKAETGPIGPDPGSVSPGAAPMGGGLTPAQPSDTAEGGGPSPGPGAAGTLPSNVPLSPVESTPPTDTHRVTPTMEQRAEEIVEGMGRKVDAELRRQPYGYGTLLAESTGRIIEVPTSEGQASYRVLLQTPQSLGTGKGFSTRGYCCHDGAYEIGLQLQAQFQHAGIPAQLLIKTLLQGIFSQDAVVEVRVGNRWWVLSGTPSVPTVTAQTEPLHAPNELTLETVSRLLQPGTEMPLYDPDDGLRFLPMALVPLSEKKAVLCTIALHPEPTKDYVLVRYRGMLVRGDPLPYAAEIQATYPIFKRNFRPLHAILEESWQGTRDLKRLEDRIKIASEVTYGLPAGTSPEHLGNDPDVRELERVFSEHRWLVYDLLTAIQSWPAAWDSLGEAPTPGAVTEPDQALGNAHGPTSGPAGPRFMLEGEPKSAGASDATAGRAPTSEHSATTAAEPVTVASPFAQQLARLRVDVQRGVVTPRPIQHALIVTDHPNRGSLLQTGLWELESSGATVEIVDAFEDGLQRLTVDPQASPPVDLLMLDAPTAVHAFAAVRTIQHLRSEETQRGTAPAFVILSTSALTDALSPTPFSDAPAINLSALGPYTFSVPDIGGSPGPVISALEQFVQILQTAAQQLPSQPDPNVAAPAGEAPTTDASNGAAPAGGAAEERAPMPIAPLALAADSLPSNASAAPGWPITPLPIAWAEPLSQATQVGTTDLNHHPVHQLPDGRRVVAKRMRTIPHALGARAVYVTACRLGYQGINAVQLILQRGNVNTVESYFGEAMSRALTAAEQAAFDDALEEPGPRQQGAARYREVARRFGASFVQADLYRVFAGTGDSRFLEQWRIRQAPGRPADIRWIDYDAAFSTEPGSYPAHLSNLPAYLEARRDDLLSSGRPLVAAIAGLSDGDIAAIAEEVYGEKMRAFFAPHDALDAGARPDWKASFIENARQRRDIFRAFYAGSANSASAPTPNVAAPAGEAPTGGGVTPAQLRTWAEEVNRGTRTVESVVRYLRESGLVAQWPFLWNGLNADHRRAFRTQFAERGLDATALPAVPDENVITVRNVFDVLLRFFAQGFGDDYDEYERRALDERMSVYVYRDEYDRDPFRYKTNGRDVVQTEGDSYSADDSLSGLYKINVMLVEETPGGQFDIDVLGTQFKEAFPDYEIDWDYLRRRSTLDYRIYEIRISLKRKR